MSSGELPEAGSESPVSEGLDSPKSPLEIETTPAMVYETQNDTSVLSALPDKTPALASPESALVSENRRLKELVLALEERLGKAELAAENDAATSVDRGVSIAALQKRIISLETVHTEEEETIMGVTQQLASTRAELAEQLERNCRLEEEKSQLQLNLSDLRQEITSQQTEFTQLQSNQDTMALQLQSAMKTRERLEAELVSRDDRLASLQSALQQTETDADAMGSENAVLKMAVEAGKVKVRELEREVGRLEDAREQEQRPLSAICNELATPNAWRTTCNSTPIKRPTPHGSKSAVKEALQPPVEVEPQEEEEKENLNLTQQSPETTAVAEPAAKACLSPAVSVSEGEASSVFSWLRVRRPTPKKNTDPIFLYVL